MSGTFGTVFYFVMTVELIAFHTVGYGVTVMIGLQMTPTLFQGAYIMRSFRLLMMYDPERRRRWGRLLREKNITQALVWPTVMLEIATLCAVQVYGVRR